MERKVLNLRIREKFLHLFDLAANVLIETGVGILSMDGHYWLAPRRCARDK